MKKIFFVFLLLTIHYSLLAQVEVYPSNWWVGMKWNKVQLMIHEKDSTRIVAIDKLTVRSSSADLKIVKINRVENRRYLFVDVEISPKAKPQTVTISLGGVSPEVTKIPFELKPRREGKGTKYAQGINPSDFVYLLMPDRFSNGDPTNDRVAGMRDQSLNRDSIYDRHGGDLQGVINHLDYLEQLGVTALWMTPVIENDMPNRTEHGYAMTNQYHIDPRFGGAPLYKKLSDELHKRGMKLVQDAVYNHVGLYHFAVQDLPFKDWLHQWPKYTQTSYKDQCLFDIHGSQYDRKKMSDGWFTTQMPDMNQSNPYVANYLIQHALWCVEEFGVDAWRIDTYIYNDLNFMNRCNKALLDEYPKMFMFGETWVHGVVNQAYFVDNNMNTAFKSNLPGATDFQTNFYGINPALTQNFGWTEGVNKLYSTLAADLVYKDASKQNVIFLDNHDLTRIATQLGEDISKVRMAIGWLLTCRGIPQFYYGDEVLMKGSTSPKDGYVRLDFPGGWSGDAKNAFTGQGLNEDERMIQDYTRTLANFRKHSSALRTGKMMQFVPEDGVYVYFRYDDKQTVMVVMNPDTTAKEIKLERFAERMNGFSHAKPVGAEFDFLLKPTLKVLPKSIQVLELEKKSAEQ